MDYAASYSSAGIPLSFWAIYGAVTILMIVAMWKVFVKAEKPGWAAIIPVYNLIVMIQISKKSMWNLLLWFLPIVQIYSIIVVHHGVSKRFGKGAGFTAGLILLPFIFWPILGFGDAKYSTK